MNINWKVRIKNKVWWLTFVPAVLLLVQVVLAAFGLNWDSGVLSGQLAAIVNAAFAVLALLGVVADPTTVGVTDSIQALGYDAPKDDFADAKHAKAGE